MSKYKRVAITSLAIVLSILFIGSTAPCKPPDDKPGKSEPKLVIKDGADEITEVTLTVGDTRLFKAEIVDDESTVISQVDVEWRVLGGIGDINPIDQSTATFTATKVGRGMVGASAKIDKKPLTAYVVVKVAEGEPPPGEGKRIVVAITPDFVDLVPGERTLQPFTATPDGDTQWRVVPPRIGHIEQDGNKCWFTAGANTGKGIIIATVQTQDGKGTGRATVMVIDNDVPLPGPKLKLHVTPKHARVDKGGSVEFEAKATGSEAQYELSWEVNPENFGVVDPAEGERTTFTAGDKDGRGLVIARIQTETELAMDWATVDIGGPGKFSSKVKISVEPEEWSMMDSESFEFTAYADGQPIEKQTAQLTWSVAPKRLGNIDNAGNFTPTAPGWGLVIAKLDTEQGTAVGKAKVYVGTEGSLPLVVIISPPTAETSVNGEPVQFTAQVTNMQNSQVTDTPIQWKAVPGSLGTISETGIFSAGSKPGHVLVTAKVVGPKGSATAQARVTINSSVATGRLQVSVSGPESVSVNGTYTYDASVTDSEGNLVDPGELKFEWRVASPSIGKVTGDSHIATFTPKKAGRCVIMADVKGSQGTGTGRISITVNE